MAQPTTSPKIEELRLRLKTDPKNRIFYPLAEELRKIGQLAEAEQVLRTGLTSHPTYLSAWVSLGRVLRDLKNEGAAAEALNKALQLDPGNVVAARLLADAYLSMGEKVEAIKKYKLVHALLPADEEVEATIERLDRELNPPPPSSAAATDATGSGVADSPFAPEPQAKPAPPPAEASPFALETAPFEASPPEAAAPEAPSAEDAPFAPQSSAFGDETATFPRGRRRTEPKDNLEAPSQSSEEEPAAPWAAQDGHVFADNAEPASQELLTDRPTDEAQPMAGEHTESPFEEPISHKAAAFEVESPDGMHVAPAPLAVEPPVELPVAHTPPESEAFRSSAPVDEADVFAPVAEPLSGPTREEPFEAAGEEEITNTLTMADLYAKQGLVADARQIYENILQRDPGNALVRDKLAQLSAAATAELPAHEGRVAKLEGWLARVGKREAGRV